MNKVIVIAGPTASGKTGLGIEVAGAIGGEIISADSMQVYKNMPIATAAPTADEKSQAPHHLVEFLDNDKKFSVARWCALAKEKIDDIISRGKVPIVVGGTGLFIDSLVDNISFEDVEVDEDLRQSLMKRDVDSLYDELLRQPEPEAARVAAALELYVSGSLNVFNHRTNVELSNRLVCFDIKQLGKQLKKLGMLIVQDQVWNRVTINRAEKKSTRYYMDEFHLLLKEEQTAAYSVEIWKRFRKWGGIPTAITQNVKDLLSSREVENIFENSDFVLMLNQAQGDREILARQLNISPQQMKYVTHTEAGEGLIFYGNVVLPFLDRFPQNTELYRVMTTRPEEVGGA